ncbi:TPA: carbohydrate ABC transporter permease [Candidatus Avacholeplasma faecigallinarum]|nr:carbohydrate ABC transporter permease [Candidatus Avacholeplasma faecigallinarum]
MQKNNYKALENKEKQKNIVLLILIYLFLIIAALSVLFPFYWMIVTSFKTLADYTQESVPAFIPTTLTFENYVTAWVSVSLGRYMINTVIFSLTTTAILVIVCILAAFAFARLQFYGKNIVFTVFLATMMIPMELFTITNYATIVNLNLRNTFVGLIFPSVISVFYIYLLRQNFMQVPDKIYYAAKVDGTTDLKYLFKILVPLSKPTIISIAILKFIECWNSYVWPRLITTDESKFLISNGIQTLRTSGFGRENIPAMMAAVVCVSIPLLVLFAVFRKQIMSGVSRSGLKG